MGLGIGMAMDNPPIMLLNWREATGWQYAMVLLNQTNAMDDEDDIVETYDKAVESFKTASKLNPGI